jgi:flavin-binding protein dodecin
MRVFGLFSLFLRLTDREVNMQRVARVTDIIAASPKGFDEAIKIGFERANRTLRNITGLRVLEQRVAVEDEEIREYRVRMEVIFLLES